MTISALEVTCLSGVVVVVASELYTGNRLPRWVWPAVYVVLVSCALLVNSS